MPQHNIQTELERAAFTSTVSMIETPEGRTFGIGATEGNGIEGWAPGAIYIDTTNAQLSINEGTSTTASWTDISAGALNMELGSTGTDSSQASLTINALTASSGSIIIETSDAAGAFALTITNAASWAQTTTLTIPDPGQTTASFILSVGVTGIAWSGGTTALALDYQATPSTSTAGTIMRVGTGTGGKIPFVTSGQRGFAIYMDNTSSGTFTGMRLRCGCNDAASLATQSVDSLLCQVSIESSKDCAVANSGFFEIIPKGTNAIGTARGLLVNIDSAASVTYGTQLTAAHIRMHTRGDETMSGVDEMLRLENEAVGGNGRQLDSFIRCMGSTLSGGIKAAAYLIDAGTGTDTMATAVLRVGDDGTIAHDTDTGDGTAIARSDFAGYLTVIVGSATRYIPLMDVKTSAL